MISCLFFFFLEMFAFKGKIQGKNACTKDLWITLSRAEVLLVEVCLRGEEGFLSAVSLSLQAKRCSHEGVF